MIPYPFMSQGKLTIWRSKLIVLQYHIEHGLQNNIIMEASTTPPSMDNGQQIQLEYT